MFWIDHLKQLLPDCQFITEQIDAYGRDYTEDLCFKPELVALVNKTIEISTILKFANSNQIPVTVRGAGTGLSGGCLPVNGGIVISMEKMNAILEIDAKNFQATVEPGVINEYFQNQLKLQNLFYPPDPASKGSCTLGGNVAHSSGGPKCVKYGTTKDYILNLEIVLANGEIIWTGANTLKNSTGYNLTQLIIGSEGTLAIVTKIVVKLLPLPKYSTLLLAMFSNFKTACQSVNSLFTNGLLPSAVEFMDKKGFEISRKAQKLHFDTPIEAQSFLLIEFDGNNNNLLMEHAQSTFEILEKHDVIDVLLAEESDKKELFWKIRRGIGEYTKQLSIYKEEDTVVPRYYLPELLEYVSEIAEQTGFETVCYGHAGDGNVHINILKSTMSKADWEGEKLEQAIRLIFKKCYELGGTISGEHGIGYVQKKYMNEVMQSTHFEILKGIKHVFDPNGILNPGKIWETE